MHFPGKVNDKIPGFPGRVGTVLLICGIVLTVEFNAYSVNNCIFSGGVVAIVREMSRHMQHLCPNTKMASAILLSIAVASTLNNVNKPNNGETNYFFKK